MLNLLRTCWRVLGTVLNRLILKCFIWLNNHPGTWKYLFLSGNYPQCHDLKPLQGSRDTILSLKHNISFLKPQSQVVLRAALPLNSLSIAARLYLHRITDQYPRCVWSPIDPDNLAVCTAGFQFVWLMQSIWTTQTGRWARRQIWEKCDNEKWKVLSVMIKEGSTRHDEIRTTPMLAECCTEPHMQIGAMKSSFQSTFKD